MRYLAASGPLPFLYRMRSFLEIDQCQRLTGEMDAGSARAATLREAGLGDVAAEHRRRAAIVEDLETQALVARKLAAITDDLASYFQIRLSGPQPPQFLRYGRGDFFRPHKDRSDDPEHAADIRSRRLTAVVFLNGQSPLPQEGGFCGGDLRLFRADNHPDPTLCIVGEAGMLVAFPSAVVHEVRPVLWGVRRTVVAWYVDAP